MNLSELITNNNIEWPQFSHSVIQHKNGNIYFLMNSTPKVALADWGMPINLPLADDYKTAEVFR